MSQKIINGDSAEVLKTIESNSIDAVVTDPPYGIEFLGKEWDTNTGAIEIWRECLRVLKPGGHLLAFSAARTYHNLATNIEGVGFDIRDQIMWIYASGFPKAQDIGKAIQRRQGVQETKPARKRKTFGFGEEFKDGHSDCGISGKDTIPTSPEAQQWSGWKTALKPAHEPIVMARKPMKGSTIDNVLAHGVGALNIDATRIPYENAKDLDTYVNNIKGPLERSTARAGDNIGMHESRTGFRVQKGRVGEDFHTPEQGRFPSNVVGDIADYQKYFYCPKVSRRERHRGTANNHPTVKPVELMKYLIRLVTPAGAHILDPFSGSGSTGMACRELGRQFTGIDLDPDYCEIARKRMAATQEDKTETLFE